MSKELVKFTLWSEIIIVLPCGWTIHSTGKSLPKCFAHKKKKMSLVNYSIRFLQLTKTKPCLTWFYDWDGRHTCEDFAFPVKIWTDKVQLGGRGPTPDEKQKRWDTRFCLFSIDHKNFGTNINIVRNFQAEHLLYIFRYEGRSVSYWEQHKKGTRCARIP